MVKVECKEAFYRLPDGDDYQPISQIQLYEWVVGAIWYLAGFRLAAEYLSKISAGETVNLCGVDLSLQGARLKHPMIGVGLKKKLIPWEENISSGVYCGGQTISSKKRRSHANIRKAENAPVLDAIVNFLGYGRNYEILRAGGMAQMTRDQLIKLNVMPTF